MEHAAMPPPPPPPHPAPAHTLNPAEERNWALFAHVAGFAGFLIPLGNVLGPLIVYVLGKEKGPFAAHHAKESLNFQITLLIAMLVLGAAAFMFFILLITIPLAILVFMAMGIVLIGAIVLMIMAAMEANKGSWYRYPFSFRFLT